jgi:thiosulfate/3-mercaptopyruvate sulfurtransferase
MTGRVDPLISVEELDSRLEEVIVCDVRWSLMVPGYGITAYESGHIPSALFVDLDRDLAADPGEGGRHPLPPVGDFCNLLGRLGIGPDTEVVVYDDAGGAVAARLWWMLRAIGHEGARLLDGGFAAWEGAGKQLSRDQKSREPTAYPAASGFDGVAGIEELDGRVLLDVRAPERYRGDVEPIDPKAGHIPGAISMPFAGNLADDGLFLPPDDLRRRYLDAPDDAIVSCGSGVNACHSALAMVLAGRPMPDVYIGSFSEWSRRDLPVSVGDTP